MFKKRDYEEKKTDIKDSFIDEKEKEELKRILATSKEDPALKHIIEEKKEKTKDKKQPSIKTRMILESYYKTKSNKRKLEILETLEDLINEDIVRDFLINIAKFEGYKKSRVKALSILSDRINDSDVENIFLRSLNDSSPDVRLWAVWGLREVIFKSEIKNVLIRKMKFQESSNKIKLWIIRALSDQIQDNDVKNSFMFLLKMKPNLEIRKLLLYYLLKNLSDPDIAYSLSVYVHLEKNKEIREELVKKLINIDNDDIQYSLSKIQRTDMDEDMQSIFRNKEQVV